MTGTCLVAAFRTAVSPRNGAFAALEIHALGAPVIRQCLSQAGIAADTVDELIVGNALGAGGNPARLTAQEAGLPDRVAGLSLDRQCCSGLDALVLADAMIRAGQAEIVIAGGTESYSRRPLRLRTFADGTAAQPYDRPAFSPWPERDPDLAEAADLLATERAISKDEQDRWAMASHAKARAARDRLRHEIVGLAGLDRDAFTRTLTPGLCARAGRISGSITTANTAVAADAAAFCLMVSDRVATRLALPSVAYLAGATVGGRPEQPGIAPVAAIEKVLTLAGVRVNDLSVAEIMEAYATQAIACVQGAGITPDITNPGGGALARGHPIGASGAINAVRLFHELQGRGGYGLAAIAAAGGLGTAVLLRA